MSGTTRPEPSDKVKRVLNGYINLTSSERTALKALIAEVDRGPNSEKMVINETLQKGLRATLGPTGTGCTCCGR